jgi:hypothetical protein
LALVPLVEEEMLRLAEALGLERVWPPGEQHDRDELLGRIRRLEERIRHLEAALSLAAGPVVPTDRTSTRRNPRPDSPGGDAGLASFEADDAIAPSLGAVFAWIEEALSHAGRGQPVRLADLGNTLKSRYGLDPRGQFGLPLTELLQQAEQAGRVRVSYRDRVPYASLAGEPSPDQGPTLRRARRYANGSARRD